VYEVSVCLTYSSYIDAAYRKRRSRERRWETCLQERWLGRSRGYSLWLVWQACNLTRSHWKIADTLLRRSDRRWIHTRDCQIVRVEKSEVYPTVTIDVYRTTHIPTHMGWNIRSGTHPLSTLRSAISGRSPRDQRKDSSGDETHYDSVSFGSE
jgi:hypothetical protein